MFRLLTFVNAHCSPKKSMNLSSSSMKLMFTDTDNNFYVFFCQKVQNFSDRTETDFKMIYCSSMIYHNKKGSIVMFGWESKNPKRETSHISLLGLDFLSAIEWWKRKRVFYANHIHISLVHSTNSFPYFFMLRCTKLPLPTLVSFKCCLFHV